MASLASVGYYTSGATYISPLRQREDVWRGWKIDIVILYHIIILTKYIKMIGFLYDRIIGQLKIYQQYTCLIFSPGLLKRPKKLHIVKTPTQQQRNISLKGPVQT